MPNFRRFTAHMYMHMSYMYITFLNTEGVDVFPGSYLKEVTFKNNKVVVITQNEKEVRHNY